MAKGNESTATPRLLDHVVLKEAVVTIDTAGCQTAIVQDLWAADANTCSGPERNQQHLHAEMAATFADAERNTCTPKVQDR